MREWGYFGENSKKESREKERFVVKRW